MDSKKEWKGFWYLPNSPNKKVAGTLECNPGLGITLILIGEDISILDNDNSKINIILGDVSTYSPKSKITLVDSFKVNYNSGNNIVWVKYISNFIIEGFHFENNTKLNFNKIVFKSREISNWFYENSTEVDDNYNSETNSNESFTVNYKYKAPINFNISNGVVGKISTGLKTKFFNYKLLDLKEEVFISIKSINSINFIDLKDKMKSFIDFIQLLYNSKVYIDSIILKSNSVKRTILEKEMSIDLSLYFNQNYLNERKELMHYHEQLLSYSNIKFNLVEILENWYKKWSLLDTLVYNLISDFNDSIFKENKFLFMAQGIESFHKRFRTKKEREYLNKRDRSIYNNILEEYKISDNHKKWFDKFFEKNVPTIFAHRINDVLDEIDFELVNNFYNDKDAFIRLIVKNRNYYSHLDIDKEDEALNSWDLYRLYMKLKIIFMALLFKEVGVDDENLKNLIQKLYDSKKLIMQESSTKKI